MKAFLVSFIQFSHTAFSFLMKSRKVSKLHDVREDNIISSKICEQVSQLRLTIPRNP